jgi:Uma2 family endonuclease
MMPRDHVTAAPGPQPIRLRFSVDEYYKMYDLGLLKDFEKSEIIDGELIKKMSIGEKHAYVVDLLNRFFIKNLGDDVLVRIQNPLRLSDYDEPEPDVVLADLTKYDGKRHPRPQETLIVIEVADASLRYDRNDKLALYAAAEIPEVWIVNLIDDAVEVHQDPEIGIYRSANVYRNGDTVTSSVLPSISLQVSDILS